MVAALLPPIPSVTNRDCGLIMNFGIFDVDDDPAIVDVSVAAPTALLHAISGDVFDLGDSGLEFGLSWSPTVFAGKASAFFAGD